MSSPARFTAVQKQCLKDSLFITSGDLNHALKPVIHQLICFDATKHKIISSVTTTAQRMLYLKMTDVSAGFNIDLLEYEKAAGTVPRRMVDREAKRCAARLYADTLIP